MNTIHEDSPVQVSSPGLTSSPSINLSSDDELRMKSFSSSGEIDTLGTNKLTRTKTNAKPVTTTNTPPQNESPAYMGDILDDIFGGSFRTPGVKASEDILNVKTITPALAFEELESIRNSPTIFFLFYDDAKEHKVLESLWFILEVEEFVQLPLDFRLGREKEIIDIYLTNGAKYEINIPDTTRRNVLEKMGKKCDDIFTEVQKYVTHMLIRNVDVTWNYKKAAQPKKELKKGKQVKKAIDKIADIDDRMRDIIYYFLSGRITPLMFQARTSVVTHQKKIRETPPIGWVGVIIKRIIGWKTNTSPISLYIVGSCYYQNKAGILRDKKSLVKTPTKKSIISEFKWETRELEFEVKDLDTQFVEIYLFEKRFLPDTVVASFDIDLSVIIEKKEEEKLQPEIFQYEMGEIWVEIKYSPNVQELKRLEEERVRREQQSKTQVADDFKFLFDQ